MQNNMKKSKLKGLGGWLILPIIGLFLTIPIMLYDILGVLLLYEFDAYIGFLIFLDLVLLGLAVITLIAIS